MTAVNYWDRATKAILGDITLPHTIRYTPGSNKLATSRRAKDGTLIVQGINNNGKIANKKTVVIRGVDEGLYYDILAEFEKAEFLYFRSPLGEEFDDGVDVGDIKHYNKVYFESVDTEFQPNLNKIEYTITLLER